MTPRQCLLFASLPQGLLIGTLLFAVITYGAVVPWAAFPIHWATLALIALTVLRALYQGDGRGRGWPGQRRRATP